MSDFYYFRQAADPEELELAVCRSASIDNKSFLAYGEHRYEFGFESAMNLFKNITFHWAEGSKNIIGDVMGKFLFSEKAAQLIQSIEPNLRIFEAVSIDGFPAYFIEPKKVDELDESLNFYNSKLYRSSTIVSTEFKDAWEAAGLLGSKFEKIKIKSQ